VPSSCKKLERLTELASKQRTTIRRVRINHKSRRPNTGRHKENNAVLIRGKDARFQIEEWKKHKEEIAGKSTREGDGTKHGSKKEGDRGAKMGRTIPN